MSRPKIRNRGALVGAIVVCAAFGVTMASACGPSAKEACKQVCGKATECVGELMKELTGKELGADEVKAAKEESAAAEAGCMVACEKGGEGKSVDAKSLAKVNECGAKGSCTEYAQCMKELRKK